MQIRPIAKMMATLGAFATVIAVVLAGAPPTSASNGKCFNKQGERLLRACQIGDYGPGGGIVFYDAGSQQSWGRYLEVAPAKWRNGKDYQLWCPLGAADDAPALLTSTEIGTGAANTQAIIDDCGTSTAAGVAAAYRGGKKSDWYLPSKDELQALWNSPRRAGLGFTSNYYWSSSQVVSQAGGTFGEAWTTYFGDGSEHTGAKDGTDNRVRPIRKF